VLHFALEFVGAQHGCALFCSWHGSAEQLSREHFFADFEVSGYFEKNAAERADL